MTALPKSTGSGLKTRHVFLDTDVYRRYGHNLEDKVMQRLFQLTRDHVCTLHITDIMVEEIKRQITDMASEVAQAVNKANRLLRNWNKVRLSHVKAPKVPDDVVAATIAKEGADNFEFALIHQWEPKRHDALKIPAKDIFDSYFKRLPPFDKVDSKEFPDAFIVAALDRWCQTEQQKMYVITRDKAMLRAVERTKTLIPLATLEDYLALFVDDPRIVEFVERIFESEAWDTVEESVRDQLGNLGTVYTGDLHDGEVIHHEARSEPVELVDYDIISAEDDRIEVIARVKAPIAFDVQYLDTSSAWWDSEEKEFIGGDKEVETLELEMSLSVLIVIDPQNKSISEIDLLTRDVRVQEPYETFK
jgi:PIN domain